MNMEDRLKQAFESEADQMRAPGGSIEDAVRRGKHRRTARFIGGAALALTLIGGTGVAIQLAGGTAQDPDEITVADENQRTATTLDNTSAQVVAFDWEQVELPLPSGGGVYNVQVHSVADRFVAIGQGFSDNSGTDQQFVWLSENGRDWTLSPDLGGSAGTRLGETFSSEEGLIVVEHGSSSNEFTVLTTSDGQDWNRGVASVSDSLNDNEFLYFSSATIGDGVHVLAGIVESEPTPPEVILEENGVVIQENLGTGFAMVSDLETGELITEIPVDQLYGARNPDGVRVYDDATAELVVVIPWEINEQSFASRDVEQGIPELVGDRVVEYGGVRLEMNDRSYTYVASDIATGALISEGSQEFLYQPRELTIVDPDTLEVIVEIAMEDFWQAQDQSYLDSDFSFYQASKAVLFRSEDGTNWNQVDLDIPTRTGINITGLDHGSNGFRLQAHVFEEGDDTWESLDGLSWTRTAGPNRFVGQAVTSLDGSLYSVGTWDGANNGIYRSDDAGSWSSVYAIDPRSTYLSGVAAGGLGLVATGTDETRYVAPAVVVSKEGKTMVLDPSSGSLVVTDDATDEILANITFDILDEDPPSGIVLTADDGFQILNGDDVVVMSITPSDLEFAAEGSQPNESFYPNPVVLFSSDGDDWSRVSTSGLDVAYMSGVAVGEDVVVISGEAAFESSGTSGSVTADSRGTTLSLNSQVSGVGLPSLWVGTPR